jgi:hypothetical protein
MYHRKRAWEISSSTSNQESTKIISLTVHVSLLYMVNHQVFMLEADVVNKPHKGCLKSCQKTHANKTTAA